MENKEKKSPMFKVYYSDGSTYTAYTKEDVWNTPVYEVLLILEKNEYHGRKIVSGGDYYVYEPEDGFWVSCDVETRNMYMARPGRSKRYLIGVMVHRRKWEETVRIARNDPDFPVQTALETYETKDGFK